MSLRPEMTAQQAEALAAYLVSLRSGQRAWTKAACLDALRVAASSVTRDVELVSRAAIRAALTASIRTPEVIGMTGAHWDAGAQLETRGEGTKATRCSCGDVHTLTAPCRTQAPSPRWRDHIQQARATVRATTKEDTADE